ncbi:MAG: glycine cleavage system aminomethyltransferase GcvT [Deltaproteobacteria bacterium]|nr:glycine cleavage system aminomethyltransferase GcvT [Deltaproteobacteria bacterium]
MALKKTPLYNKIVAADPVMVPYAGYEMAVRFGNIKDEHNAVRNAAGLFDVSHMSEFRFKGEGALKAVNMLISNDLSKIADGDVQYNLMCNDKGGVVDDLLAYKISDNEILLVMNAACHDGDLAHILANFKSDNIQFTDETLQTGEIALQGPKAFEIFNSATDDEFKDLEYMKFTTGTIAGAKCLVSRTGYTGEDGYEIYFNNSDAEAIFDIIMTAGKPLGLQLIGLGARDTLRLEAKMPLYGNELDVDITPFEAKLGWAVDLDKDDFIGKSALLAQKETGIDKKLFGLKMIDKAIGRHGYDVVSIDNPQNIIGHVTSGAPGITLSYNIALAYLPAKGYKIGSEVGIDIRGKIKKAVIIKTPFYKRPSK